LSPSLPPPVSRSDAQLSPPTTVASPCYVLRSAQFRLLIVCLFLSSFRRRTPIRRCLLCCLLLFSPSCAPPQLLFSLGLPMLFVSSFPRLICLEARFPTFFPPLFFGFLPLRPISRAARLPFFTPALRQGCLPPPLFFFPLIFPWTIVLFGGFYGPFWKVCFHFSAS